MLAIHNMMLPEHTFYFETKFLMKLNNGAIKSKNLTVQFMKLQFIECII